MQSPDPGFASGGKRILDDFDPALTIDKRHVESHVGQLSCGLPRQKLGGGGIDPLHLPAAKPFRRPGESPAFLDLDEDHGFTVTGDQVDFPRGTAPAPQGAS